MRKNRFWNNILIVFTIFGVGAGLIIGPFRGYLALAAQQVRAGRALLPMAVGIAYVIGFFVTRTVEDSFDAIFNKAPFSDIGEKADNKPKHPGWVDKMLIPIAYALFLIRVLLIVGAMVALLWGGQWLLRLVAPNSGV